MYDMPQYIPQGWQCPVCKRVYAPDWPFCTVCGNTGETTVTATNTTPVDTFGKDAHGFARDYMTGKGRDGNVP